MHTEGESVKNTETQNLATQSEYQHYLRICETCNISGLAPVYGIRICIYF